MPLQSLPHGRCISMKARQNSRAPTRSHRLVLLPRRNPREASRTLWKKRHLRPRGPLLLLRVWRRWQPRTGHPLLQVRCRRQSGQRGPKCLPRRPLQRRQRHRPRPRSAVRRPFLTFRRQCIRWSRGPNALLLLLLLLRVNQSLMRHVNLLHLHPLRSRQMHRPASPVPRRGLRPRRRPLHVSPEKPQVGPKRPKASPLLQDHCAPLPQEVAAGSRLLRVSEFSLLSLPSSFSPSFLRRQGPERGRWKPKKGGSKIRNRKFWKGKFQKI